MILFCFVLCKMYQFHPATSSLDIFSYIQWYILHIKRVYYIHTYIKIVLLLLFIEKNARPKNLTNFPFFLFSFVLIKTKECKNYTICLFNKKLKKKWLHANTNTNKKIISVIPGLFVSYEWTLHFFTLISF